MYLSNLNHGRKVLRNFIRCFSSQIHKSHYEVLNLRKDCSDKEIKEAFIKLSKEYHPDVNKDPNAHARFVKIVEAYNVLSKPGSRAQYDNTSHINYQSYSQNGQQRAHSNAGFSSQDPYSSFYENRDKSKDAFNEGRPYYGVHGVHKLPNSAILFVCLSIAVIGVSLQIWVISSSNERRRRNEDKVSMRNAQILSEVRARASQNSNEIQTKILLEKIASAANPSIATATMGSSLATENNK